MDILTTLGGGAAGALFGAVGSAINRGIGLFESREKRKDRAQEMAHEKDRWAHESQAQAQALEGQVTLAGAQGSWSGLAASITADGAVGPSYRWVAAVRALIRPGLTILLWLLFAALFLAAPKDAMPGALETVSFSAATALAWWFGDRAPRRE